MNAGKVACIAKCILYLLFLARNVRDIFLSTQDMNYAFPVAMYLHERGCLNLCNLYVLLTVCTCIDCSKCIPVSV